MANLVLLGGVPGCGKSTWAKTFFDLKYAVVSSDAIRKRQAGSLKDAHSQRITPWDEFYLTIEERLQHQVDVIADATFLTRRHRQRAREVADKTNAKLHLVLFKNWHEGEVRNAGRNEDERVPPNVMEDMYRLYYDSLRDITQESYDSITKIESFA